jgi:hypothetical protein
MTLKITSTDVRVGVPERFQITRYKDIGRFVDVGIAFA